MTTKHRGGGSAERAVRRAHDAVDDVTEHPAVEAGARVGYAANAVMHLLIALIAVQLSLGHYVGNADQSGALGMLAEHAWGQLLLWVGVVGWVLLAVWQLGEALKPWAEAGDRAKAAAKFLVYLALAWACFGFARHAGTSSSAQSVDVTKGLLGSGAGVALVLVGGLVVLGVGAYHVYKGWTKRFLQDLRRRPDDWVVHAGRVGYVAKGLALMVAGALVAQAALAHDAAKARGLDGAFRAILEAPFGRALVALVGLGFASYALYSLARARYAKV